MYRFFVFILLTIVMPRNLQAITFDISLTERAQIDIQITERASDADSRFKREYESHSLARLALDATVQNQILLRQIIYTGFAIDFFRPEDRISLPRTELNPLTIEIPASKLQELAHGHDQVFVIVRLRTYRYIEGIVFFKYLILLREFVPVGATITIQVSGSIAPGHFNELPPNLQSQYSVATGTAIVT